MARNLDQALELTKKSAEYIKEMQKLTSTVFSDEDAKRLRDYGALIERVNKNIATAYSQRNMRQVRELNKVGETLTAQHEQFLEQLKARQNAERTGAVHLIALEDERFQEQLDHMKQLESMERKKAQLAIDNINRYGYELERMNRRVEGTIFDPKIGFFNDTGATLKNMDANIEYGEKKFGELASTFGDVMSGSVESVVSRFDSLVRGSGGFLQDLGTAVKQKQKDGGDGSSLGMLTNLGGMIQGLGTAITAFAAVAASVFAIFKVMQAIEEKIKEVNKDLVDTYGGADLLGDSFEGAYERINAIRQEIVDPSFSNMLGVSNDEARKLMFTFNDIGINFASMQREGLDMQESIENMKNMTYQFQASAKTLGVDFSSLVGFSKEFTQELGVSVSKSRTLEMMTDEFGRIRDLAKQSSLNTKDFFSTVSDLSQGIGNMNIRIGEAAQLFVNLSKVLGPEAAKQFTQGLAGGFKGEGIQDRFKRIILTGGMKGVMKRSAEQTKKDFFRVFGSKETMSLLDSVGINKSTDLSKMTDAELEKAMGILRRKGGKEGEGAARKLMQSVRLARGGAGGLNAQALAIGELDMSGTLSAQMKQLYNVTAGKGFRDVTAIEMEKISQMTGKSIEELEQMRLLDMAMRDDYSVMKKLQEEATVNGRVDSEKLQQALADSGLKNLTVKDGKIIDNQGRVIDNIQAYIESQGAALDASGKDRIDQLSLLQDVVEATMTSSEMLSNTLGGLLQTSNDYLSSLTSWFLRVDSGDRQKRLDESQNIRRNVAAGRGDISKKRAEAEKKYNDALLKAEKQNVTARGEAIKRAEEERALDLENLEKRERALKVEEERARILASSQELAEGDESGLSAARLASVRGGKDKAGLAQLEKDVGTQKLLESALKAEGLTMAQFQKVAMGEQLNENFEMFGRDTDDVENEKKIKALMERLGFSAQRGKTTTTPAGNSSSTTDQEALVMSERGGALTLKKSTTKLGGLTGSENTEYSTTAGAESSKAVQEALEQIRVGGADSVEYLKDLAGLAKQDDLTEEERAQIQTDKAAESKKYKKMLEETGTNAYIAAQRKLVENETAATFKGESLDLTTMGGRDSAIQKIEARISALNKVEGRNFEQENELQRLNLLRSNYRKYYAQDAVADAGKPFLGNAGSLVIGSDNDIGVLLDKRALLGQSTGAGGGNMTPMSRGGQVIVNVNGNNTSAMMCTINQVLRNAGLM